MFWSQVLVSPQTAPSTASHLRWWQRLANSCSRLNLGVALAPSPSWTPHTRSLSKFCWLYLHCYHWEQGHHHDPPGSLQKPQPTLRLLQPILNSARFKILVRGCQRVCSKPRMAPPFPETWNRESPPRSRLTCALGPHLPSPLSLTQGRWAIRLKHATYVPILGHLWVFPPPGKLCFQMSPRLHPSPPRLFQCLHLTDHYWCPVYNCKLPPSHLLVPSPLIYLFSITLINCSYTI